MTGLVVLDPAEVHKISAIASRMQSDHDGEALNAARMTCRALDKHGLRIGDVLAYALRREPAPARPASRPEPARPRSSHITMVQRCLSSPNLFNQVETKFLIDVGRLRSLSHKQREWLNRLFERASI